MSNLNDREQLPDFLLADPTTEAISEALRLAGTQALDLVASGKAQFSPATATWGLPWWERILGIIPPPGASLEQRRRAILAKFMGQCMPTKAAIEAIGRTMTGHPSGVTEHFPTYMTELSFYGAAPGFLQMDFAPLYDAVNAMIPAHLLFFLTPVSWQSVETIPMTMEAFTAEFPSWTALENSSPIIAQTVSGDGELVVSVDAEHVPATAFVEDVILTLAKLGFRLVPDSIDTYDYTII